ncbi:hypothetical protein KPP03845_107401 [Streptomyces xanthophaeus]|nr:hypothetical protein KPP03845_107401 [Streptomyces xanthophaeus]
MVTFHRLEENKTKVMLQLDYEPDGFAENVGDKLGLVKRQITDDLKRFKEYIEDRGRETGSWRGEVGAPPDLVGVNTSFPGTFRILRAWNGCEGGC